MASRYWVGGDGDWDATSTTHWSSTSGGTNVSLCDYRDESNCNTYYTIKSGGDTSVFQTFISNGESLNKARFYLFKIGSPTGYAYAKLYKMTGTYGTNGKPTGSVLATSAGVDVSTCGLNSAGISWKDFTFSGQTFKPTYGVNYCIAIEYTGGNSSNLICVGSDSKSTHSGNCGWYSTDWHASNARDLVFYLYTNVGVPTQYDDVIFDLHSNEATDAAYQCILSNESGVSCHNLDISFTGTTKVTISARTIGYGTDVCPINIYGNLNLSGGSAQVIWSAGDIYMKATSGTSTINTNGVQIPVLFTIDGIGGTFQLTSDFHSNGSLYRTNGTFDANNYTIHFNGTSWMDHTLFGFTGVSGLYNVVDDNTVAHAIILASDILIKDTLTISSSSAVDARKTICSDIIGTTRTLTVGTITASYTNFQDIAFEGECLLGHRIGDGAFIEIVPDTFPQFTSEHTRFAQSYHHLSRNTVLDTVFTAILSDLTQTNGSFVAKIYASSGVIGTDSIPTGEPLATSNPILVSTLTGEFNYVTFEFSSYVTGFVTNEPYVLVIEFIGTIDGQMSLMGFSDISVYEASGGFNFPWNASYYDGSNWVPQTEYTTFFAIYYKVVDLSNITGKSGDLGGNYNAYLTSSTEQHWLNINGGNFNTAANWTSRVPLPQDDVIFDCTFGTSKTITANSSVICRDIDFSGATWTTGLTVDGYVATTGDLTLKSGLTYSADTSFIGSGDNIINILTGELYNKEIDTKGVTLTGNLFFNTSSVYTAMSNITLGKAGVNRDINIFEMYNGTFDANDFDINVGAVYMNQFDHIDNIHLIMGNGTWSLANGQMYYCWNCANTPNITITSENSTIKVLDGYSIFYGGDKTYNNLWLSTGTSTGYFMLEASNTFNDIRDTGTEAHSIILGEQNTTTVNSMHINGSSGKLITIQGYWEGIGPRYNSTLIKTGGGVIGNTDYIYPKYITGSPENTWHVGSHSTNDGTTTGLYFDTFLIQDVADTITLSDSMSIPREFITTNDTISVIDEVSRTQSANRTADEVVTLSDNIIVSIGYNKTIADTISMSESISARKQSADVWKSIVAMKINIGGQWTNLF